MNLETKYDIGQIILFNKVTHVANKDSGVEEHVGIIEKILFSGSDKISYLMKSSYQNWVSQEDIICVLTEEGE